MEMILLSPIIWIAVMLLIGKIISKIKPVKEVSEKIDFEDEYWFSIR